MRDLASSRHPTRRFARRLGTPSGSPFTRVMSDSCSHSCINEILCGPRRYCSITASRNLKRRGRGNAMSGLIRGPHHCVGIATSVTERIFHFLKTRAEAQGGTISLEDLGVLRQQFLASLPKA